MPQRGRPAFFTYEQWYATLFTKRNSTLGPSVYTNFSIHRDDNGATVQFAPDDGRHVDAIVITLEQFVALPSGYIYTVLAPSDVADEHVQNDLEHSTWQDLEIVSCRPVADVVAFMRQHRVTMSQA